MTALDGRTFDAGTTLEAMMGVRILLAVAGVIAVLLGTALFLAPDALITAFQVGVPDLEGREFARSTGVLMAALGLADLLALRDVGSPAVFGLLVANLLFHVGGPVADFLEPFPKDASYWGGFAMHALLAIAFIYFIATWNRAPVRPAHS